MWLVTATQLADHAIGQSGNLCSWSPDALRLLFVCRDADRHFLARYDVATQSASRVFVAERGERIHAIQWSPNWSKHGKQFVVVVAPAGEATPFRPRRSTIHLISHPEGAITQSFSPLLAQRTIWGTPIWLPDRILVEAPGMIELIPATGKMYAWQRPKQEADAVFGAFGIAIGYLSVAPLATGGWSIGAIDAKNQTRTVYSDSRQAPHAKIQHLPAFAPIRERIALPAVLETTRSILIFEFDLLLETRALADESALTIDDLQWSPDSTRLYVLGQRPLGQNEAQHVLLEVTLNNDTIRETKLFTTNQRERWPTPRALAISANGRTAAVAAGLHDDAPPSLYLIDLTRPERTVTNVPPPPRSHFVGAGSEYMTELARHWLRTYQGKQIRYAELLGGGSSDGFEQMLQGTADLALMGRPPTASERATATRAGVELVTTLAKRDALAVCVHPDNPIATIELPQLRRLFKAHDEHRWSKLGVQLPTAGEPPAEPLPEHDEIAMAMFLPGSRHYMPFRNLVLNGKHPTYQATTRETMLDLAQFVTRHRNAIACLPMREAIRQGPALRMVAVKTPGKPAIAATPKTIADGSYPLLESWYVVHNKKADSRARPFCEWLVSKAGQAATAEFDQQTAK